ncbi:hypothetical protein ID866_6350 [Astraeus odoratus]|nr:hypothetical protein ID866_6350 [Astraeus odoratus]
MSDAPEQSPEIQINIKGPSELKLQISISTDKTVLELKQAIADKSDVEANRQRLIYSGRVLKDDDKLSAYRIQSSHTIHMVKGASRPAGSSHPTSSLSQTLPAMQAGQNPHDPLTQLNGPLGFGLMAGFNPFADMGVNPNDPNMFQSMMESPEFARQMSTVMSDPAILDQIIAMNPQLQAMGPQVRQVFQSEQFRQMLSDPQALRSMLQFSSMFQNQLGGTGGGFPAPGVPSTATSASSPSSTTSPGQQSQSPQQQPPFNPFALFGQPPGRQQQPQQQSQQQRQQPQSPFSPFGADLPALLQSLQGQSAAFGGIPAAPADTRPPEERFQVQLQQLQDMGFTNASQNVRALLATGGNVHSAIEYILSGGGL